ncbi:MAG: hypothetical protein LBC13_00480, partial [Clostridiales bacterium]|nr:hypothetical protein [Clostridiales bacterium]
MEHNARKKNIVICAAIICLLACAAFLFAACNKSVRGLSDDTITSYDIVADFDAATNTLTCFQDVQWVND